jgi:hypothetical protein
MLAATLRVGVGPQLTLADRRLHALMLPPPQSEPCQWQSSCFPYNEIICQEIPSDADVLSLLLGPWDAIKLHAPMSLPWMPTNVQEPKWAHIPHAYHPRQLEQASSQY